MVETFPEIGAEDGRTFQLLIDNEWRPAGDGATTQALSPINDELVGRVAAGTVGDAGSGTDRHEPSGRGLRR